MKSARHKKIDEIRKEIAKLKKEVDWLYCHLPRGFLNDVIFGVKKPAFIRSAKELFNLQEEDIEILQNRRISKIKKLYDELAILQDLEEKGGEQG